MFKEITYWQAFKGLLVLPFFVLLCVIELLGYTVEHVADISIGALAEWAER